MRIVNNITALNATNIKANNTKVLSKSIENLSSGLRINKAADDAAGLAISQKMRAQIRGLSQASRNAQDGISMLQTAEGAIGEMTDLAQRMRELCIQAANGTLTDDDRDKIQLELNSLKEELSSIASKTEFNTKKLLDGSLSEYLSEKTIEKIVEIKKELIVEKQVSVEKDVIVEKIVSVEKDVLVPKTIYVDKEVTVEKIIYVDKDVIEDNAFEIDQRQNLKIPNDGSIQSTYAYIGGRSIRFELSQNLEGTIEIEAKSGSNILGTSTYNYAPSLAPAIEWEKSYGGLGNDSANTLEIGYNGSYVMIGTSDSNMVNGEDIGNHGSQDIWVVNYSSNGNINWQTSLGGMYSDYGYDIHRSRNEGYLITGHKSTPDGYLHNGFEDLYIARLDSNGHLSWERSIGGDRDERGYSIVETSDHGYIVAGYTTSADPEKGTEPWIIKFESGGGILWEKTFVDIHYDRAEAIRQTDDGGYVVIGTSFSDDENPYNVNGYKDIGVFRLNSDGEMLWNKTIGGLSLEEGSDIQVTPDGGFIITGITQSSDIDGYHDAGDAFVAKLDSDGNIQWQKALGGSKPDKLGSVSLTSDGGYVLAGFTSSTDGDVTIHDSFKGVDYWIVKLNSNGEIEWERTAGGGSHDRAYDIKETEDGGYMAVGYANFHKYDVSNHYGGTDAWVVKFSPTLIGQEYLSIAVGDVTNGNEQIYIDEAMLEFVHDSSDGQDMLRDISIKGILRKITTISEPQVILEKEIISEPQTVYELERQIVDEVVYEIEKVMVNETIYETQEIIENVTIYEIVPFIGKGLNLQIGANAGQSMEISIDDMRPEAIGFTNGMPRVNPIELAGVSLTITDQAIQKLSTQRSSLGAYQNRLEHVIKNLDNSAEKLQAAESRITDLDMAKGVAEMTKLNILNQAADAMIAQANQQPQGILQLLK